MKKTTPDIESLKPPRIRTLKKEDLTGVSVIMEETGLSYWSPKSLLAELLRPDNYSLVLTVDQQIAGFSMMRLIMIETPNSESPENSRIYPEISPVEAELLLIGITPRYQRKGLGRKILNRIISELSARGCQKIYLEVRESNVKALDFYQKHDFRITGERSEYYSNPPEKCLVLSLDPGHLEETKKLP